MQYGLSQRNINDILDAFTHFPEIEQALLFGSRAKGNYQPGSDVDLAIKGQNLHRRQINRLSDLLNEEYPLPYFFDVLHYETVANSDLVAHIDRVGKVIYPQQEERDFMTRKYKVLNEEQVQSFLEHGYLVVKDCFEPAFAKAWTDQAFTRLGYDPEDATTWEKDIVWMDHANQLPVHEISSKAWGALCDVVGGEGRIETQVMRLLSTGHFTTINTWEWSDSFIVNFSRGADEAWVPPSPEAGGWHKDGSYFRHFLDSREQALLTIVLWSDVGHRGGGTFIAPDSVRHVAKYLYEHPEGVDPGQFRQLINQCSEFKEVTGEVGDFIILHPFMLHASSHNHSGKPRFMTNPPVVLKEPMNLNRDDPANFSLLEQATLHYLELERLDFQPTGPRESRWVEEK